MKLVVVQCSAPGCSNTFDHSDELTDEQVEQQVSADGWKKNEDGTWTGCSNPEACICVSKEKVS